MWIDSWYIILVMPAVIFSLIAQAKVTSTFKKFSQVRTFSNMTGKDAAEAVLRANGVYGVTVERVAGNLTDHYDPRTNVIRLSDSVYASPSVAAVGVAAHEAGHAVQYAQRYSFIGIRQAIIPISKLGSSLAIPLFFIGIIFNMLFLQELGVIFFGAAVLFQLVTLPVEFNASKRALRSLESNGILSGTELVGAKKTLTAAAMTYVAAMAVSLAQFLRLLLIVGGNRRND